MIIASSNSGSIKIYPKANVLFVGNVHCSIGQLEMSYELMEYSLSVSGI